MWFSDVRHALDVLAKVDAGTAATTLEPGATATGPSKSWNLLDNRVAVAHGSKVVAVVSIRRTAFLQKAL